MRPEPQEVPLLTDTVTRAVPTKIELLLTVLNVQVTFLMFLVPVLVHKGPDVPAPALLVSLNAPGTGSVNVNLINVNSKITVTVMINGF